MNKKVNNKIFETNKYKKNSKEFKLIEFINNYPTIIVDESINSISQKLVITTSTLTRLVRKLGFKNYINFRSFIIEKVTENKKYLLIQEQIDKTDNTLKNLATFSNVAIEKTFHNIDNKKFEAIINEIIYAKRILLFGIGFSYSICYQLSKYFEVFNINNCNISDFYHALRLVNNSANDLWIIISISLKTKEIVFLLEELTLKKHKKIIVITSNDKHIILKNVFYVLTLKSLNNLENEIFQFDYKTALTAVANLLINSVINKINYNKVQQILEFNGKTNKWKK